MRADPGSGCCRAQIACRDLALVPATVASGSEAMSVERVAPAKRGVYVPPISGDHESRQRASRIRVAGVEALPSKNALRLALRPFARRHASPRRSVLDEEATVRSFAETGGRVLVPRFRAVTERWFDVALVVEDRAAARSGRR